MRKLIIIIWLVCSSSLFSQFSIIDSIIQKRIESKWINKGDYFILDYKPTSSLGNIRDYGDMLFCKSGYGAIFIDKQDGRVFQKMWQSLNGKYKDEGGYPYALHYGNWDLSPTDTSVVIVGEYGTNIGEYCNIISYKERIPDTLYNWVNTRRDSYQNKTGSYDFYALSNTKFLLKYDLSIFWGPDFHDETQKKCVDIVSDTIIDLDNINLGSLGYNDEKTMLVSTSSYYYLYSVKDSNFAFYMSLKKGAGSGFFSFLKDDLCLFRVNDTLHLYNLKSKEYLAKYYTGSFIYGNYYDKEKNVANIVIWADKEKRLLSIHIPTRRVVMDKKVNLPYLGAPITKLKDGYQLSYSDGGYLYKHTNDIFKYDTINADFEYTNSIENNVQFNEKCFGAIVEWNWDFGDGVKSEESNPTHQYASAGEYDVTLHIVDAFDNKATITKKIKVEDKLKAGFDFAIFTGKVPLTVEFQNYSTPNSQKYIWNFGDGTYSYAKNPAHTFTTVGTYTVSLTVVDKDGNFNTYLSGKKVIVTE